MQSYSSQGAVARLPSGGGGIRTTSYADAQRLAQARAREDNAPQIQHPRMDTYRADSGNLLQKMKESQVEAERLRLKCREAALASAARTQHEEIQRHIEQAKSLAQANSLHHKEAQEAAMASALASDLGWSSLPNISQEEDANFGTEEVLLPGALEPFEVSTKPAEPQVDEAPSSNVPRGMTSEDDASAYAPAATDGSAAGGPAGAATAMLPGAVTEDTQEEDGFGEMDEPIIEEELEGGAAENDDKNSDISGGGSKESSGSEESSSGSYLSDETDDSDKWPPDPPVLRFKMRMQFSQRFKPTGDKEMFQKMNEDLEERFAIEKSPEMKDPTIGWINLVFAMQISTEYQFEVGFPIIVLTMLDAIYPKRVRWREIDWGFQYKRALQKNFAVLELIWAEVNMEKAREFRVENTPLRLENLSAPNTPLKEKLEFTKLMKRWFDQRIHHAGPYDPMAKRHEFVEQCKTWGHAVKFPSWIIYDKEFKNTTMSSAAGTLVSQSAAKKEFDTFPEYKRLIWFLGSPEYQTM